MNTNGDSDPGVQQFSITIPEIVAFLEREIEGAAAVRNHLERDSRSRRTWAATERAYEKVLQFILSHQQ